MRVHFHAICFVDSWPLQLLTGEKRSNKVLHLGHCLALPSEAQTGNDALSGKRQSSVREAADM